MNSTSLENSKEPLISTDVSFNGYSNGETLNAGLQRNEKKSGEEGGGGGEFIKFFLTNLVS